MKLAIKWIILITTALIFLYAFSASYRSQNIDHLDYAIAIGVDSVPDSDNLKISFEFTNSSTYSQNSSSEDSDPIINTVVAPSISSGINIINAYVGKQLNLSHCKVIVFSEDFAKKGILSEVTYLMNSTQIRPTANIIIAKESAKDYLENSISSLEQVLTKYYEIFPYSSEYTGYTSNILLSEFYENLINKNSGSVTILGKKSNVSNDNTQSSSAQSSSDGETIDSILSGESIVEGDRGTENIGLCVFKDDKYVGDLSAIETLCYSLIEDDVDSFLVSMASPFDPNKKIDITVDSLSASSVQIDTSKENPVIDIKINLTAKTLTGQDTLDYSNTETLNTLNSCLKDYLSSQITNYLYKTSKEYKVDINEFYRVAKRKFLTIPEFENYNWAQKYENAEFNVEINSDIISSLLIQNS